MIRVLLAPVLTTLFAAAATAPPMEAVPGHDGARMRLRALGVTIGRMTPGRWNAITDVAGVRVGQVTLRRGEGALVPGQGPVRTGVTAIVPRDDVWHHKVFANTFVLNGNGEMTASSWVNEAGWLETPIVLTDTLSVGKASDAVVSWMERRYPKMGLGEDVVLPMVAECDDEFLNDQRGRHVREADVVEAIESATTGPVAEGAVGAGTGMVSYRFKGGIGTASRVLSKDDGGWTVGALVNANMGAREDLRIDGVPVGQAISDLMPLRKPSEGSIIMVIATDAPLLPHQLQRLAKRAALGLARTGTIASHGSGDFVVAFSTAADVPDDPQTNTMPLAMVHNQVINPLFQAAAESVEEAIGNALTMATTTVGRDGNTAFALPLDRLKAVMKAHGRLR